MIKDQKHICILVIEDNLGDFVLVEEYLFEKMEKPEIHHAKNFKEGSFWLKESNQKPDIILLDLTLPDKSGELLIQETLAISENIPVIVLTGFSNIEFSIRSIAYGIYDYLVKDELNSSILYKSIIYALERKKINEQIIISEKKYSNLFHFNPQPMWVYRVDNLTFIQVNQAAIKHYGYAEEEFLNMTILNIRPEMEKEKVLKSLKLRLEDNGNNFSGIFKHVKKNGDLIDVEVYSTPIEVNEVLCRLVVAIDITERTLYEHKITRAIIKTQEDERYEIGSELHDNVCQILATSLMSLGMIKKNISSSEAIHYYDSTMEYINLAANEIRNLSHRLAPVFFNNTTFEEAIQLLLYNFNISGQYIVNVDYKDDLKTMKINPEMKLNLYRIMQEQLRNIMKYARASTITLKLYRDNTHLFLELNDDGVGFSKTKVNSGIGMANMKRRAELYGGSFVVDSSPGHGCAITVTIPIKNEI